MSMLDRVRWECSNSTFKFDILQVSGVVGLKHLYSKLLDKETPSDLLQELFKYYYRVDCLLVLKEQLTQVRIFQHNLTLLLWQLQAEKILFISYSFDEQWHLLLLKQFLDLLRDCPHNGDELTWIIVDGGELSWDLKEEDVQQSGLRMHKVHHIVLLLHLRRVVEDLRYDTLENLRERRLQLAGGSLLESWQEKSAVWGQAAWWSHLFSWK